MNIHDKTNAIYMIEHVRRPTQVSGGRGSSSPIPKFTTSLASDRKCF